MFLALLGETAQAFQSEVHAYSLMDNHYHLLIHTPQGGLGRALRHLNGVYTLRYNRRNKTDGPLFRGRYKARLIEAEDYLLAVARYIHLNPVEAGLVKDPAQHSWTSHCDYLKGNKKTDWLITEEILSRFGGSRKDFHAYVMERVPTKEKDELKKAGLFLGSKCFKEWVYQNWVSATKTNEIPKKQRRLKWDGSLKGIMEHVAFMHDINVTDLRNCSSRQRNDARSIAIYLARKLTGVPQKDLARWMNVKNPYAIAKAQQRFAERVSTDSKLRKLTNLAERQIWSNVKT